MGDHPLRDAIESLPGSLKDWTVMAPHRDPFRLDTRAGHRDGQWLADRITALRLTMPMHLRGLHYALIGRPKPNGEPYTNTDKDWHWLGDFPAKCARTLGYVGYHQIIDERSDAPLVIEYKPPTTQWRQAYVSADFELPADLDPVPLIGGLHPGQPYRLVLVGEKTSLQPVLSGVARRNHADLFLETGDVSDDHVYRIAQSSVADPRPMVICYFSDCDPSGHHMGIVLSRKLQAHQHREFPDLEFQVHRAGLTPDQVRQYGLPYTPLKPDERRGDRWRARMGVEQTEIDALAALQPQRLREIAEAIVAPFYDRTLDGRVQTAIDAWTEEARDAIEQQFDPDLRDSVQEGLEEIRERINALVESMRAEARRVDLPDLPDRPQAVIDEASQPVPLCDSAWSFEDQCRALIASKNYEDGA